MHVVEKTSLQRRRIYAGPQRENFPGGTKVDIGPPKPYRGPTPLNHFLLNGCKSSFESEGLTIFAYSYGPMKNTTRHKIGLNPARGSGGAL